MIERLLAYTTVRAAKDGRMIINDVVIEKHQFTGLIRSPPE